VRLQECLGFPDWSAGRVLAYRQLTAQESSLLLDAGEVDELSTQIDGVLAAIHEAYPEVPEAGGLFEYVPGSVTIGLEPEVAERLNPAIWNSYESWPVSSFGNADLDTLAADLGFKAVEALKFDFPQGTKYHLNLCLDELVNPPTAAKAFDEMPGVVYAEVNGRGGDGPDTAVERQGDDWYVVIRDASGDCPAGCTDQQIYFFIVGESGARRIEQAAVTDPVLLRLARSWDR
jgi:hypothetical protein